MNGFKFNFLHAILLISVVSMLGISSEPALAEDVKPIMTLAANNVFIFNPRTKSYTAINSNGKVVRKGRASGGRSYCPDIGRSCRTPSGTFHIISKGPASCKSSRYPLGGGGAKMPYCMFFSKYYAIHGSDDVPNYNASHGCVRVRPGDAYWLSKNFIKIGTKVIVKSY